jgi:hypothetical protein
MSLTQYHTHPTTPSDNEWNLCLGPYCSAQSQPRVAQLLTRFCELMVNANTFNPLADALER